MLYNPKWEEKINVAPTWRTVLLRAAEIVRERGLAKYIQEDSFGSVCIHGAISIAANGRAHVAADEFPSSGLECEACEAVCAYLRRSGANNIWGFGAANWNNESYRTADEVIAALEGAALS